MSILKLIIPVMWFMLLSACAEAATVFVIPHEEIDKGISLMMSDSFDKALVYWEKIQHKYPDVPDGYFFRMMTLHMYMVDLENYSRINSFNEACDTLQKIAVKFSAEKNNEYYVNFYSGVINLYNAFIHTKTGNSILAVFKAASGAGELEKCVEADSSIYEPYLLLGSYKYWKSAKSGFLRVLKVIKDERRKGTHYLQKVREKSDAMKVFAGDQLAWIYVDKSELTKAYAICKANLEAYPNSRALKWTYGNVLLALKKNEEALRLFYGLNREYLLLLPEAQNNYLSTLSKIFSLALKIKLRESDTEILLRLKNEFVSENLRKKLSTADRELIEEINKLLESLIL